MTIETTKKPASGGAFWPLLIAGLVAFFAPQFVYAGGGPENVLVVVNADSPSSKLLANLYVHHRSIPAQNVVYLNDIVAQEMTSLNDCKKTILGPVLREIEARKLTRHIDYIVYSSDFPSIITVAEHFHQLAAELEKANAPFQKQLFTHHASLTSLTYFAEAVMADQPGYMLLESNTYYRLPAPMILRRPFVGPRQTDFEQAIETFDSESEDERDEAIKKLEAMVRLNPGQVALHYWLARFYARKNDASTAAKWLTVAARHGWCFRQQTQSDLAFESVKDDPLFRGFVARLPDEPFEFAPSRGFKHGYRFGVNGMLNLEPDQGNRFYLSTMLGVTRNEGTNEKEAHDQLIRSMGADQTHPEGTFYFSDTEDIRNKARRSQYDSAVAALQRLGHQAEIISTPLPRLKRDVLGLTTGTPTFNWTASGSRFVPGAIGDNFTSYGGKLDLDSQTKFSEFLRNGAAGGSGTVVEPYAIPHKFPHAMIHVHYARGCTLAEAFYQSVRGPFQLLIVGDALCQPFATSPIFTVSGIEADQSVSGSIEFSIDPSDSPIAIAGMELYMDGVLAHRGPLQNKFNLDTSKTSDGYHEIRLVAIANSPMETTGHVVLPIHVDNQGHRTTLSTDRTEFLETDTIRLKATSNVGDSIELLHNMRPLAKKIGREVEFEIPASLIGRGTVKLEAIALTESAGRSGVSSFPVELTIEGPLSVRKDKTEK